MSTYPGPTYVRGTAPPPQTRRDAIPPERLTPQGQDVPDSPIRLQEGWLACRTCGVAVPAPDPEAVIHLTARGRAIEGSAALTQAAQTQHPVPLAFALCPACRRTADLAERLAPAHPTALHLLNCALDALSYLAPATVEQMADLDADGQAGLVRHLAQPGTAARWVSRFVPSIAPEAEIGTCPPHPFAHLMPGQRKALRAAYAALLRERVARTAPPVAIPPPRVTGVHSATSPLVVVEGGCLLCGVGHQSVPAAAVAREGRDRVARDLWTARRTGAQPLGGRLSPATVSGHLCRVCAEAVTHAGAFGPTALERALVVALAPEGVGKLPYGQLSVDGAVGWGALVAHARQQHPPGPEPRPNERPWEHLDDLDALSERLGAALG